MIDDPYKELGIEHGASPDDIKRAYRRKAKEYHPDLHPDDPNATEKMNRINEAYDMLTHPEKYQARRAQEQRQNTYQNPYQNPFYSSYGGQQSNGQNSYQGGGQYYDPFDFANMFGFGARPGGGGVPPLYEQEQDPPFVRMAVRDLNARQFAAAKTHLDQVVSTGRNARWYYLSALAEKGLGNVVRATDNIQRAVQMEPNNQAYHQLLTELRYSGQTYANHAADNGFHVNVMSPYSICTTLCLAQMLCNCLCGGCGGGRYYY